MLKGVARGNEHDYKSSNCFTAGCCLMFTAYFKTNMTLFVLASSAQQPPCACEGWAPEQPEWAFSQTCSNCTAGYNIGSSCQHTDMLLVRMGDAVHTE